MGQPGVRAWHQGDGYRNRYNSAFRFQQRGLYFTRVVSSVTTMLNERFIRLPAVEAHVGLRRSKIYALVQEQRFPKQIKLGRVSVWLRTEVTAWMDEQISAARS